MTYKELQAKLKTFKAQGLTTIALNSKKAVLEKEYTLLTTKKKVSKKIKPVKANSRRMTQEDFYFLDKCVGATNSKNKITLADYAILG